MRKVISTGTSFQLKGGGWAKDRYQKPEPKGDDG
jgi:hypothetical protein